MTSENSGTTSTIPAVKSIDFSHFRGFKKQRIEISTNADLVLITGPNGYGKSSFLEGLLLVLTGWKYYDSMKDIISLSDSVNSRADNFKIEAKVGCLTRDDDTGTISIDSDNGELNLPKGLPESRLGDNCELEARLCGFFPERVNHLFDQACRGNTLRDVYDPLKKWISGIHFFLEKIPTNLEEKKKEIDRGWSGEKEEILSEKLKAAWLDFAEQYKLVTPKIEFPTAQGNGNEVTISRLATDILSKAGRAPDNDDPELIEKMHESIDIELRDLISNARKKVTTDDLEIRKIKEKVEGVNQKIQNIDNNYPNLRKNLTLFKAKDPNDPDMEAVFRTLVHNAITWSSIITSEFYRQNNAPGTERLKRVLEEFAAVMPEEAGKCSESIKVFLKPLKDAEQELKRYENEKKDLEAKLIKAKISDEVNELLELRNKLEILNKPLSHAWKEKQKWNLWISRQEHRLNASIFIDQIDKFRQEFSKYANKQDRLSNDMMDVLKKNANRVMGRFSLVDGVLPLKIDKKDENNHLTYWIKTADDREFAHFSTGQRAQSAIAFLTAQNLMVSHRLTHRIIILDDVTTSYDLSNLTREALLWRQLAYGMEDQQTCRQIFISSHHEDLTNHLLDLLVPPEGHSMKLLKFEGWTPNDGPEIKVYDVKSTHSIKDSGVSEAFAESLKELKW